MCNTVHDFVLTIRYPLYTKTGVFAIKNPRRIRFSLRKFAEKRIKIWKNSGSLNCLTHSPPSPRARPSQMTRKTTAPLHRNRPLKARRPLRKTQPSHRKRTPPVPQNPIRATDRRKPSPPSSPAMTPSAKRRSPAIIRINNAIRDAFGRFCPCVPKSGDFSRSDGVGRFGVRRRKRGFLTRRRSRVLRSKTAETRISHAQAKSGALE